MQNRINAFYYFLFFLVFLSGCGEKVIQTYHLSLMGESEHWKVESYKIDITPETLKAGGGIVTRKDEQSFYSDAYILSVYAAIDQEHVVIQRTSASGNVPLAMNHLTTGTTEGSTHFAQDGEPITLDNVSEIYMIIEWEKLNEIVWFEEKIELYRNPEL